MTNHISEIIKPILNEIQTKLANEARNINEACNRDERCIESLNQWYRDQDERNLTPEIIDDMAQAHQQELISEGRIHLSKLITKE